LLPLAVWPRRFIFHESSIPSRLLVSRQHICLHEPHQPKPLSDLAQTRPPGRVLSKEIFMPFARIDLAQGKPPEYRATVGDVVYEGIVGILKAPDGDRFMVIGEHAPENFVFDPNFLDIKRSPDLIYIQVTSTVGNTKEQKLAFFRHMADELNRRLGVRREDVFISLVFVDRDDWSFGNGEPW
jgi:phenylpyruvate tautomerase PptA (4-oxalocrotonate tautomerase family)